jgi:diguanylate cyclase (GGDEF)-like protein
MDPNLIEIGYMNPQRWENIAKIYTKLGFCTSVSIPKGFLYDPNASNENRNLYYLLFGTLALLGAVGGLALYVTKLNRTIKEQAIRDPLTGVYNRRYLDETLPREIARAQRELSDLSLVMLDLDHFKVVNDTHGHSVGDLVLKNIATCLIGSIRQNDFVARFGGEEFIIVMPGMPTDQAFERMELCRKEIENIVTQHNGQKITITISGGISSCITYHETQDELIKQADDALYVSKENGRNRITLATKN